MNTQPPQIFNVDEVDEEEYQSGSFWHSFDKPLTPAMRPMGGKIGVNLTRVPPGSTATPFHAHQREDEVFFILSGKGVFRYGDTLREIRAGDCISCPARTGVAHQLANPYEQDLTYIVIGPHDPDEVCFYPDSGKILVRSLGQVGYLNKVALYLEGEPPEPVILEMAHTGVQRQD
jgi:uncharacterized cupin superfamily protein